MRQHGIVGIVDLDSLNWYLLLFVKKKIQKIGHGGSREDTKSKWLPKSFSSRRCESLLDMNKQRTLFLL